MWRKIIPTLLLAAVLGAGVIAWFRLGSAEACERWASVTVRKARVSYTHLRGPAPGPFGDYVRAMYERPSFKIDGNLYVNPGGCDPELLPARPEVQP